MRMNETVFSALENWREEDSLSRRMSRHFNPDEQQEVYRKMLAGESGIFMNSFMFSDRNQRAWFAYAPIKANGWSLALIYPRREALEELISLNSILLFVGIFSLFVLFGFVFIVTKALTLPVIRLTRYTREVSESGNYRQDVPQIDSHDEIGDLANSFAKMMKEIDEAQTTLEDRVKERTAQLVETQEQLIQSEKMASLGELAAGISHEIQNPLNFVNNFSEVSKELIVEVQEALAGGNYQLTKEILDDVEENLDKINHHGKRADSIIKGMLQHSRSSVGSKEATDINALADEYFRLAFHGLRARDKSFNAAMETDFDESMGKIGIIPQEIGRVVLNLITNAFYAVNARRKQAGIDYQPTVWLRTRRLNGCVEVEVTDNGNGIPEKDREKIFQPFFTTKPSGEGTGLGLSMSYDIVTKGHGGELKMESREGEGTTFTMVLPIETGSKKCTGIINGIHLRVFEAIGAGTLPLVEWREDIDDVFGGLA